MTRFRRLLEPLHERAQTFARCLCRSSGDGDDLYQEAVLRAFTRIDQLRDDDAFRSWFYRIIVSVHRNRSRGAFWRRLLPLRDDFDRAAIGDSPDAAHRISLALSRLPDVQREAVVLFELQGLDIADIAQIQEVSKSAVKSRLVRARARLRVIYGLKPDTRVEETVL
jgi:RNA polymerase sigma-70 factor, ECF subfamily